MSFGQSGDLYVKGKVEFLTGNYLAALKDLLVSKNGIEEQDKDYLIAMTYFNLKEYENAILYFDKDLNQHPNNINSYMQRSESKKKTGDFRLALKDLNTVLEKDGSYFLAYVELGNLNYDKREYELAIKEYMKALELKPNFEKCFYKTGFCYLNLKDTLKATENWKKIEDLDDFVEHEKIESILKTNIKPTK